MSTPTDSIFRVGATAGLLLCLEAIEVGSGVVLRLTYRARGTGGPVTRENVVHELVLDDPNADMLIAHALNSFDIPATIVAAHHGERERSAAIERAAKTTASPPIHPTGDDARCRETDSKER